jgi:DNA-directed RNA polymerase subunit M/transcription elongation factor TFIIS
MLPKLDVPVYELTVPSTGKKLKFRPFTVKEEKLLMMAYQSDDVKYSIDTIMQVLNNCIIEDVDVSTFPTFDIEFLFLHLRARSVGEVVNLKYRCNNTVGKAENGEEQKCNNLVEIDLNVLEVEPYRSPDHTNKIELNDNLGIVMKYPKMSLIEKADQEDEYQTVLDTILECIDYIYDADNIYYAKDSSKEELAEFLDSLQGKDLEKIKHFFDTMPKMKKTVDFKCKKCGYHEEMELEGLQSFFG